MLCIWTVFEFFFENFIQNLDAKSGTSQSSDISQKSDISQNSDTFWPHENLIIISGHSYCFFWSFSSNNIR